MSETDRRKREATFDLQQLRSFREVAMKGSFTRAAKELGYAQSAVTHHVRTLEQMLGTALLERERFSKSISLTESGCDLLKRCENILSLVDETVLAVRGR